MFRIVQSVGLIGLFERDKRAFEVTCISKSQNKSTSVLDRVWFFGFKVLIFKKPYGLVSISQPNATGPLTNP